ncbi:rhamnulokinase family protein [Marispirochaeta aestuarii]|uniref:rhamnulokinase n=1 Tax=Marispirochaeta aestuarii TaxID=1963862 RepID=UPI0029C8A314|nr:rhamnulokinase family protein [Marispirochaeta aestuarii]
MIRRYVAVDLGAESGRVIVGQLDNGLNFEVISRFPSRTTRIQGTLYWDILYIFEQIKQGLAKAVSSYGREIVSIGVDTWGVDYGLIDSRGRLMASPVHYRDDRTDGMMDEVFSRISREQIYSETGIQFMQINTLFQLAAEAEQNREGLARAERVLMIPDLLNYWLSGIMANEYSIATTSQLYNPVKRCWSRPIFEALKLEPSLFTDVVMPGTVLGPLRPDLAKEIGAEHQILVAAVACHDTASAVAAVPSRPGEEGAYLSSGTWSLLGIESPEAIISPRSLGANITNEGAADGGIRFLKNIMGLWILQECRRSWEADGDSIDYSTLSREAAEARDHEYKLNVDDSRFLKPGRADDSMPQRILEYCAETGQPAPRTPPEFARGIFRGLAAAYGRSLEEISGVSGRDIHTLHIIGGGCQNRFLNQLTADVAGIPVSAGPVEATALGNIMLQAIASGDLKNLQEGRDLIGAGGDIETFTPA